MLISLLALSLLGRVNAPHSKDRSEIVAAGTPEDIVMEKRSYTARYLKPVLAKKAAGPEEEGTQRRLR